MKFFQKEKNMEKQTFMARRKDRLLVAIIIVGFVVVFATGGIIKFSGQFQTLLFNPAVALPVTTITLIPIVMLVFWARHNPDRKAMIAAIMLVGGIHIVFVWFATTIGWWAGKAFLIPVAMQLVVYGIGSTGGIAGLLALYRWLTGRSMRLALVVYGLFFLASIPAIYFGDRWAVQEGIIEFAGGYTVWTDILYGEMLILLTPFLYEFMRRRKWFFAAKE